VTVSDSADADGTRAAAEPQDLSGCLRIDRPGKNDI
jgi:hypothetical protein